MALIETISRRVSDCDFHFHFYVAIEGRTSQLALAVDSGLARIPRVHLNLMDQNILVVNRLPGGRATGGGFYPHSGASAWRGSEARTGVTNEELDGYLEGEQGIIAITKAAFERNIVHLSVTHEAAHSLDDSTHIYPPGATLSDFAGIRYPRPRVGEYAAEAYSRYFAAHGAICRGGGDCPHPDAHPRLCDAGIIATLMDSPAFRMLSSGDLRRGHARSTPGSTDVSTGAVTPAFRARTSTLSAAGLDVLGSESLPPRGPCGCGGGAGLTDVDTEIDAISGAARDTSCECE